MIEQSPPSRGRGSKQVQTQAQDGTGVVAPFAGAWIETLPTVTSPARNESPPSRGRGSKHYGYGTARLGLAVAPFAGAWIETAPRLSVRRSERMVAPFAGAWIETPTQSAIGA